MNLAKVTWDDIKDDLEIDDVINELGIQVKEIKGFEHMARCPLPAHPGHDKNPSFSVNTEKMLANCFVCGGYTIPQLVMALEGIDEEVDAIAWLLKFSDFENADDEKYMEKIIGALGRKPPEREERYPKLPYFSQRVVEPWVLNQTDFFTRRRISSKVRNQLKLGYDPEHTLLGYTGPAAIIPHFFRGKLVGYQRRWDSPEDEWPKYIRKYMNTDDFPKKFTLYAYDIAIQRKDEPVFVVESALTVARLMSAGFAAVSTFGASVNKHQTRLLAAFSHLILSPDNDEAGEGAMGRLYKQMDNLTRVSYVPPPDRKKADLGDADDEELAELLEGVEPAFMHFADL
jgi:hypothetical protein